MLQAAPAAKLAPKPTAANAATGGATRAAGAPVNNGATTPAAANGAIAPRAATNGAAAPASGGAAVLAKLHSQRAAASADAAARKAANAKRAPVTFLYASQTGTAEEIAHSLFDEAKGRTLQASVNALDDQKFDNINPQKTPVLGRCCGKHRRRGRARQRAALRARAQSRKDRRKAFQGRALYGAGPG